MSDQPPEPRLVRSSAAVGAMTLISRVLGLMRDVVFARYIGAEAGADAFFVAFKIPNFMRRLFAEGAFAQAFVPVLSEYRSKGSHAAVRELLDRVAGCLGSVLVLVTVLAVVGAPLLTALFAPGFLSSPEKAALTSEMIRITFPYLLLISLTGFAGAVLNSYDHFVVPAFTPVLLNLCLIAAAVLLSPYFAHPVVGLAWGVLMAGMIQLLFQLPFLARRQLLPRPKTDWRHPGVRKILMLMAPALFGVSVSQINLLLDTVLASLLPEGSVSWLYYSDRLSELPLGVFGIAIATVILPNLSRQHAEAHSKGFQQTMDWALRMIVLVAVPATLALILLAFPILLTLFQYGKTQVHDVQMSSLSLQAYALGLLAFMAIKVLAPGYYARQDTKTPVKIGIVSMLANMVLNLMLVAPLYYWFNLGHVGLALATSLAAYLNAGLLLRGLMALEVFRFQGGWRPIVGGLLVGNTLMSATLWWLTSYYPMGLDWPWWHRALHLGTLCGAGLVVYLAGVFLGGARLRHFRVNQEACK